MTLVVRLPRIGRPADRARTYGSGAVLEKMFARVGVPSCGPCRERARALDSRIVFLRPSGASSGPPAPKPGCWFAGTNCYGFIQTLKFCCQDGGEYTEFYGWCVGGWLAPPCRIVPGPGGRAAVATTSSGPTGTPG